MRSVTREVESSVPHGCPARMTDLARAEANAESIRRRLAEEREDAKRLEPRRLEAIREHTAAATRYESARDEAQVAFEVAEQAAAGMQHRVREADHARWTPLPTHDSR